MRVCHPLTDYCLPPSLISFFTTPGSAQLPHWKEYSPSLIIRLWMLSEECEHHYRHSWAHQCNHFSRVSPSLMYILFKKPCFESCVSGCPGQCLFLTHLCIHNKEEQKSQKRETFDVVAWQLSAAHFRPSLVG